MKIIIVAGARPNFIKIAPLLEETKKYPQIKPILVHTEQHYDYEMSKLFFDNLDIPKPDIFMGIGSGRHGEQVGKIMIEFEKILLEQRPDLLMVVGDVNSTIACSLTAVKLHIPVAHVESGLRSFDRTMPEEINRVVTDSISSYLFVSEESGIINLEKEGLNGNKVFFVGNVMIDTLIKYLPKIDESNIVSKLGLENQNYAVTTLHRPSNVDTKDSINEVYDILKEISNKIKLIYPIHPRAKKMIEHHKLTENFYGLENLSIIDPLGYLDFIKLVKESKFIITDSGGIQEETTVLGVPCLTMRENTERPVTIQQGTNYLVARDKALIIEKVKEIISGNNTKGKTPNLWDGKTAERIVKTIL